MPLRELTPIEKEAIDLLHQWCGKHCMTYSETAVYFSYIAVLMNQGELPMTNEQEESDD